jgi:hypothetical protein
MEESPKDEREIFAEKRGLEKKKPTISVNAKRPVSNDA